MVKKQTQREKYQQRLERLEQEIQKAEELIEKTQLQVQAKRQELDKIELLLAKEILIENNMSIQDLVVLLSKD